MDCGQLRCSMPRDCEVYALRYGYTCVKPVMVYKQTSIWDLTSQFTRTHRGFTWWRSKNVCLYGSVKTKTALIQYWISTWYANWHTMMTSSNGNIFRITAPLCGESPHKDQWRGAVMLSLICAWINRWVNNNEAGDLRRHRAHYDITVMILWYACWDSTANWLWRDALSLQNWKKYCHDVNLFYSKYPP